MIVRVKLFAIAREKVGKPSINVELPDQATVRQLRSAVAQQYPNLASAVAHSRFAVNSQYAADGAAIPPEAEIALIPPVSGG